MCGGAAESFIATFIAPGNRTAPRDVEWTAEMMADLREMRIAQARVCDALKGETESQ